MPSYDDGDPWVPMFLLVAVLVILGATGLTALIIEGYERWLG